MTRGFALMLSTTVRAAWRLRPTMATRTAGARS
jgi:hypothetical protein